MQLLRSLLNRAFVERAFADFIALDGRRAEMFSTIAAHSERVELAFEAAREDPAQRRLFARMLLDVCAWIDDGKVGHRDLGLRSYVDVSLQLAALRIFIDWLDWLDWVDWLDGPGDGSLQLTRLLLEHFPDSRPALLAHATILLEQGEVDAAMASIQRALRVQAVCQTAQRLLFRAYRAKRDQGSTARELEVVDYDLGDRFCEVPFVTLSTGWKGGAFACSCPAWVPYPIGNVLEAESADALWSSEAAAEIRRSILDGDFSYCSRTLCSRINARTLPARSEITDPVLRGYIDARSTAAGAPRMVDLNYDTTCNLACPSCRTEILSASSAEQAAFSRARDRVILPLLRRVEGQAYISGGGEAFASKHYRSILRELNREAYPGLGVFLITNAQLLTPQKWSEFPDLAEMTAVLSVSIDAARAETYERLRRPGKWSTLMHNLEFIAGLRRAREIPSLWINFVVQKSNYREMLDFVALGNRLGADKIWFQRVVNYGAYDEATFADIDVTSPAHPEHARLLEVLRDPVFKGPNMNVTMLASLFPRDAASPSDVARSPRRSAAPRD